MRSLWVHWKIGIPGLALAVILGLVLFGAFTPTKVESQDSFLDLFAPPPEDRQQFEPGRSQIIAVGLDQPLVMVDVRYAVTLLALVREGATPIDRVVAFVVTADGSLLEFEQFARTEREFPPDRIWESPPFNFADAGLAEDALFGQEISLNIGNEPGDVLVAVFDIEGRSHFFPNLEFARAPMQVTDGTDGYDGYGTQYSSVFN